MVGDCVSSHIKQFLLTPALQCRGPSPWTTALQLYFQLLKQLSNMSLADGLIYPLRCIACIVCFTCCR